MERNPAEPARIDAIPPSRAIQYGRISSEHQQHSMESQLDIVCRYAAAHGIEVVEIYPEGSGFNNERADE
jgi:DNA invertase Pin-like site-specific DNA recombinase